MSYLSFIPIYQERVWGGRNLATKLGRTLPEEVPIGESWEIVDREEAMSVVSQGPWKGMTLRDVLEKHGAAVMGPDWDMKRPFPILIKWLDCQERLSLQVHPPAHVAGELGGEPKTENWYVVDATAQAAVIAGVKPGVTRETFAKAIQDNTLEECVFRFPTKPGDSLFVESGRLHAIDGGNLILEIQQNSDTTYRVYDWGRRGLDGKPRQLHVDESLASIDFNDNNPELIHSDNRENTLAECREFRIRKITWQPGQGVLELPSVNEPRLISMVSGQLQSLDISLHTTASNPFATQEWEAFDINRGMNVLIPYGVGCSFKATEPSTFLMTDHFTNQ